MAHALRKEAVKVDHGISSFLNAVMENNHFADCLRVKGLISVLWNKELEILKVAERSYDRMGSICDIRPIRCEPNRYMVRRE
jgi:hypothetical protein